MAAAVAGKEGNLVATGEFADNDLVAGETPRLIGMMLDKGFFTAWATWGDLQFQGSLLQQLRGFPNGRDRSRQ